MKRPIPVSLLASFLLTAVATSSVSAAGAAVKTNLVDHSNHLLIEAAAATATMGEALPAKVWKVYPASKYAFVSQVEGGMKGSTCVVSARVMLVPLTPTAKAVLFRPQEMATAFDALPNSSIEACKALAKDKLTEATKAVASSLVKT